MHTSRSLPPIIAAYKGLEADHSGYVLLVAHIYRQIVAARQFRT
jgi:hypothetical protein